MSDEALDVSGMPTPNDKRILVELVELKPRILSSTGLEAPPSFGDIRAGRVRAIGPNCPIQVRVDVKVEPETDVWKNSANLWKIRPLAVNDVVTFPKQAGTDVSGVLGGRPGNLLLLHDGEVTMILSQK